MTDKSQKTPEEIGQDIVYPENKTLDALWESICSIYPWVGERLEEIRFRAISAIRAERTHPAPEVREALVKIREILTATPELNMENYDKGEVAKLNNAAIEIFNVANESLSAPSLEAVECFVCRGVGKSWNYAHLEYRDPCPQRCDKGKVWVRKS